MLRRSGRPEQAEPAVREYADAERLFIEAARPGSVASPSSTPGRNSNPPSGSAPPPPPPKNPVTKPTVAVVEIGPILESADQSVTQGKLADGAATLADGLQRTPDNARLKNKLRDIVRSAEGTANTARQAADTAGVSSRREYADATARLGSGAKSGHSERPEDSVSAVRDYVAAAQLFRDAVNGLRSDMAGVGRLLDQYEAAYSGMDAAAVGRLDPTVSVKQLQNSFSDYKSFHLSLTDRQVSISPQGDAAIVSCIRDSSMVPKKGDNRGHGSTRVTVTLRRANGEWRIASIK
jgi:ketosteroid isomerase-like protein